MRKTIEQPGSAGDVPQNTLARAATAYSRELPQPKFSPPTRTSPGRTSFANPGRASQNAYVWNLSWPTMNGA